MPKLKTHQGTKKRVRKTKSGKLIRRRPYGTHFLSKKSAARKRGYAKNYTLGGKNKKNIEKKLG